MVSELFALENIKLTVVLPPSPGETVIYSQAISVQSGAALEVFGNVLKSNVVGGGQASIAYTVGAFPTEFGISSPERGSVIEGPASVRLRATTPLNGGGISASAFFKLRGAEELPLATTPIVIPVESTSNVQTLNESSVDLVRAMAGICAPATTTNLFPSTFQAIQVP